MNSRLQQIIQYKTGGRHSAFAALVGWSPQYLAKLIRGVNFGLRPVMSIAIALPEINLRWFLLGEGEMLLTNKVAQLQRKVSTNISGLLDLDRYIRFMSSDEIRILEKSLNDGIIPVFPDERIAQWRKLAAVRDADLNVLFTSSIEKSCKVQTHK